MHRAYHRWRSRQLERDMELLIFGHHGPPYIVFPTSQGAFFEYEDRGMVGALSPKLESGALQLVCVSTVDSESFYAAWRHPRERIDRYLAWERYLIQDVVPLVAQMNGAHGAIGVTGCSFGAYHAFTMALRHPDVFTSCVAMGGAFDVTRFLGGYYDTDVYLLSPPHFLPNLYDEWFLSHYRRNKWVLITGEHDICRGPTEDMAAMLAARHVPHSLHVWGHGSEHDWPEWRRMADAYIP